MFTTAITYLLDDAIFLKYNCPLFVLQMSLNLDLDLKQLCSLKVLLRAIYKKNETINESALLPVQCGSISVS